MQWDEEPATASSGGGLSLAPGGLPGTPASIPVTPIPTGSDVGEPEGGDVQASGQGNAALAADQIEALRQRETPPEGLDERRAWHVAHALPAWRDVQLGMRPIEEGPLHGPVRALLENLERESLGQGDVELGELMAQQRQLLGALEHNYPRHFELHEPMDRLAAMLDALDERR